MLRQKGASWQIRAMLRQVQAQSLCPHVRLVYEPGTQDVSAMPSAQPRGELNQDLVRRRPPFPAAGSPKAEQRTAWEESA